MVIAGTKLWPSKRSQSKLCKNLLDFSNLVCFQTYVSGFVKYTLIVNDA